MKKIAAITLVMLVGVVARAESKDERSLAGQKDFSAEYLESIVDEKAAEEVRREKDRKDHEKYLRSISRR